jgi:hypothetical protein
MSTTGLLRLTINIWMALIAVDGFGQRLEWARNGPVLSAGVASSLKASDSDDHSQDPRVSEFRQRLERSFEVFDGDSTEAMSAFVRRDGSDKTTSSRAAVNRMFSYDVEANKGDDLLCEGEDCDMDGEECEIPDTFKVRSSAESVDVMSLLGIRRAEPLRVRKDWQ